MSDEIIREVWRAKDALAKRFNYDLAAFAAEMRKRQRKSGRRAVNLAAGAMKRRRTEGN